MTVEPTSDRYRDEGVGRLILEIAGHPVYRFDEGPVRFGRQGPEVHLHGDEMPREVGTFVSGAEGWKLRNRDHLPGRSAPRPLVVTSVERGSTRSVRVMPSTETTLPGLGTVAFIVGAASQVEFLFRVEDQPANLAVPDPPTGAATSVPTLTPRQIDYLVAFAEPELRGQAQVWRRSQQEVADLWHVSVRSVESAIEEVRLRFQADAVLPPGTPPGRDLIGAIVRAAVGLQMVTADDLAWAALDSAPRSARENPARRGR